MSKPQDIFGPSLSSVVNKPYMNVVKRLNTAYNSPDADYDCDLDEVLTNTIPGASLAANVVTLPAGEYYINGSGIAMCVTANPAKLSLKDTSGNFLINGMPIGYTYVISRVAGVINLSQTTSIKLFMEVAYVSSTAIPLNLFDESTPIHQLEIWKLDGDIKTPYTLLSVNEPIAGAPMTGNIFGGELIYNTATTFDTAGVSCMDDSNTVPITIAAAAGHDLGTPTINTVYHVFACKNSDNSFSIEWDTDINGTGLPVGVAYKRWLGPLFIDATGSITKFWMYGNNFTVNGIVCATGISTAYVGVDFATIFSGTRVKALSVTSTPSATANTYGSYDGVLDLFAAYSGAVPVLFSKMPYAPTIYFKTTTGTTTIRLVGVELLR